MRGIRKADKLYFIQVSFTVRHINNKKNMLNNEIDKIMILFFILYTHFIVLIYSQTLFLFIFVNSSIPKRDKNITKKVSIIIVKREII